MNPIKLRLWHEQISLEDAFLQLIREGVEQPVLKELAKRILYQRNFQEYKLDVIEQKQIDALRDLFCQKLKLDTEEALQKWLKAQRQTEATLMKSLIYAEQISRLKNVVVTSESVKELFIQRKGKMDAIVFGLLRLESGALARELYYRLCDDNHDFGELAREYSKGPEAIHGGVVGPKPINELNPELRKYLQKLQPGEVSEPFTLDEKQYIIAKVLRLDNSQLTPQLEVTLRDELFEQWTERQLSLADIAVEDVEALRNSLSPAEAGHV
jgi:parvulin-like peptidyl-prolyl isomerase